MIISNTIQRAVKISTVILLGLALGACQSVSVKRGSAEEQTELSGKWNAIDSKMVSKKMITGMLDNAWLKKHMKKYSKEPTVIVGSFRNLSHEIINVGAFVADIERVMINSGEIEFVASKAERGQIRAERQDQELNATSSTRKAMGKEAGADYMLTGTINSFTEQAGGTKNIQYQIDLTLTSLRDNKKVWSESQKHAKTIERSMFGL
jgi:hypothetical protein